MSLPISRLLLTVSVASLLCGAGALTGCAKPEAHASESSSAASSALSPARQSVAPVPSPLSAQQMDAAHKEKADSK